MSGPCDFAHRLLSHRGALVETLSDAGLLETVLPAALAQQLRLPEHTILSEAETPGSRRIGYGGELLDRMIGLATVEAPVVQARAVIGPVREALARAAAESFVLRNGVFSVGAVSAKSSLRLWLHAAYTLHADEKRQGLTQVVVSPSYKTPVAGFEEAASSRLEAASFAVPGGSEMPFALSVALRACTERARAAAQPFREAIERRFQRDRQRIEDYFAELLSELARRGARGRIDPADLEAKRQALERDRLAKHETLAGRYVLRLEISLIGAVVVEAPVYRIAVELRRRKAARPVEVEYDCATRRLVPLPCEACREPAPQPAACDEAVHLLCQACAPRAEGRIRCGVCIPRSGGHPNPPPLRPPDP